jgi:hypothetical protein
MRLRQRVSFPSLLTALVLLVGSLVPSLGAVRLPREPAQIVQTTAVDCSAPQLFATLCSGCHRRGRSGIDLDEGVDRRALRRDPATWTSVLQMLETEAMPPTRYPQPSVQQRLVMIQWLKREFAAIEAERSSPWALRRLQQSEYRNAVRDLLAVDWQPPLGFPADDHGWDTACDIPRLPASLAEHYERAADVVVDAVRLDELLASVPTHPDGPVTTALMPLPPDGQHAGAWLRSVAQRAFRRPLTSVETAGLMTAFMDATRSGATVRAALKSVLRGVLTSPHFVYCVEARCGTDQRQNDEPCTEIELASRLALFLWSSIPDEPLLQLAVESRLRQSLPIQTQRMLADPRAAALAERFAAAWLELDRLEYATHVDEPLRTAMRRETEQFIAAMVREDRSILECLDANYSFVNEPLAAHYGIDGGVQGETHRRVSLANTPRRGLLTHASILTLTSSAGQVSPVQRGKWVLDNVLGVPPSPPPVGLLGAFSQFRSDSTRGSLHEIMARHRTNASCASCHERIDAIGFALGDFDASGAFRPVDVSRARNLIVLPSGETVDGLAGLQRYLLDHPKQFIRAVGGKLLGYALDRRLQANDQAVLDRLTPLVVRAPRIGNLVLEIVQSAPLQMKHRDP